MAKKYLMCKRCGMCCKAIALSIRLKDIKEEDNYNYKELKFLLENWVEMSKEEALKINPYLNKWHLEEKVRYFYKCLKFDEKTNLCTIQGEKPYTCSSYPNYGRISNLKTYVTYSENCVYNIKSRKVALNEKCQLLTGKDRRTLLKNEKRTSKLIK